MRTATALVLLLLVLPLASVWAQAPANPLEGSWRMIKQTLVYEDTTIVREENQVPPSTKILNSTHFSWGYQTDDGEDVLAGGGRYTFEGDTYIEYIDYHTSPPLVGMELTFEATLEGDSLWHHTGRIGSFVLKEVWRRVK